MPVITFWGSGKEQVGKTLSVVAIATNIAIEHNKRVLVISASYNNDTIKNCYWSEQAVTRTSIFRQKNKEEVANGIEGLAMMVQSNKVSPNLITNYTRIVFKDRLEILLGFDEKTSYTRNDISNIYSNIVQLASKYYDLVFVDLDNEIEQSETNEILSRSDLIIAMTSQKISSIKMMQEKKQIFPQDKVKLLIGRYDKKSKYTIKNLTRMLGEKKELLTIPYNTLYFEAAQEGTVSDLLLRLRRIEDKTDENAFFIEQVKKTSQEIMNKIDENKQMR